MQATWRTPALFASTAVLCVGALMYASWNMGNWQAEKVAQRQQANAEHIQYARDRIAENCSSLEAGLIAECVAQEIQAAQDFSRAESDLDAQQAMAFWAKLMFYATTATVFLTLAALFAIIRTLHHTRRAADSADSMLVEARRTTSATIRAWIKLDVSIRSHQKHVSRSSVVSNIYDIGISVENIGNSPAFEVHTQLFELDTLSNTHETVIEVAKEAHDNHGMYGKSIGVSLFQGSKYIRPWMGHFVEGAGPDKALIVVTNYKTVYGEKIHQTALVKGIGWNGMDEKPDDLNTSTFSWSGGFST